MSIDNSTAEICPPSITEQPMKQSYTRDDITARIDQTTKIPTTHRSVTPPPPQSIKIELTGICNLRCGFCALTKRLEQPKSPMKWELLERIIYESHQFGIKEIGFFYIGESFTAMDILVPAIKLATDLGFENRFLTSNATVATPERVKKVIEAGLTSLKWSVNNQDAEQFAEITARPAALFTRALNNIAEAFTVRNEIGMTGPSKFCQLSASSIWYNDNQANEMTPFLEKNIIPFVDKHYWLPSYTMGGAPIERELELGIKPTAGNQGRIGALVDPIPCWAGFNEAHVTSSGMLSFCCFDASGEWTMADLNQVTLAQGWHSDAFQLLRKAHLQKEVKGTVCETCAFYS